MITVKYNRDALTVSVEGHAQSAQKGQDIVCSAASILTYTIAADIMQMQGIGACSPDISLCDGYAEIVCNPADGYGDVIKLVLDSLMTGYKLLAKDFPDNISVSVG